MKELCDCDLSVNHFDKYGVRIVHKPTRLVVWCDRFQNPTENASIAMQILTIIVRKGKHYED